jgi:hypothetical protein
VSGDLDGGNGPANALVVEGTGTLSSRTYGFSTLAMQGIDWTVSSPVEITSASTIGSGTLRLTGTLTSPVISVAPGATLAGTGTLQGAFTVHGVIAPGVTNAATVAGPQPLAIGTLSVTGSYTQTSARRYEVDVSPQGHDLISVDGTATLQGGIVQARLRAESFTQSDTYKIISTTSRLTGVFPVSRHLTRLSSRRSSTMQTTRTFTYNAASSSLAARQIRSRSRQHSIMALQASAQVLCRRVIFCRSRMIC